MTSLPFPPTIIHLTPPSSPPFTLRLRPATSADILPQTHLSAQIFRTDSLKIRFYPRRFEFYDDWVWGFSQRLRRRVLDVECVDLVAEVKEDQDDGEGEWKMVGLALWEREGMGPVKRGGGWWKWAVIGTSWLQALELRITKLQALISSYIFTDRSVDMSYIGAAMATFFTLAEKVWASYPSRLHLAVIGVDPEYQRRGIGAEMIKWGQEMAKSEGVAVVLSASPEGEGLYTKMGFKSVYRGDEMEGSTFMVWTEGGVKDAVEGNIPQ